jgi:thiamine biosynthesis lipoprotein
VQRRERVMGTPVRVDVRCGGAGAEAVEAVFAWLRRVDATFSTYDPGSEISRVGRGALPLAAAHPLVREVLDRCEALHAETGGAFDARAAGRAAGLSVDPTGLVKGWAVERAAALLEAAGARRFLIDAGGDVVVRGGAWRVGIRHPRRRRRLAAVVALDDGAVATSGAYERGPHIVDPRTGRPATAALSVTVLGHDLGTADAYATAAFAMGSRGPAWTAGLDGYEAMTIVPGDRVLATPGFLRRCPGGSAARSLGRA